MAKRTMPESEETRHEDSWRKCASKVCSANFDDNPDDFIVGGDGDWSRTITCTRCRNVRYKIPVEVLAQLLSEKWWNTTTCAHVTYDYCVEFINLREEWWTRRIETQESY